jgi:hypothetical protein
MGTAISNHAARGVVALALIASGCAAQATTSSRPPATTTSTAHPVASSATTRAPGFAWLRPRPAPTGWGVARIPTGAVMRYPSGWRRIHGDAGTATAVLRNRDHEFVGYLNLTPRQSDESLGNWASFRLGHNAEEGDRGVTRLASASGMPFRSGPGSCVRDAYTTLTGAHFIELACLVKGPTASSVIVGASPPAKWAQMAPLIERSISTLTT